MESEYLLEMLMESLIHELRTNTSVKEANWTKTDANLRTEAVLIIKDDADEFSFNIIRVYPAHINTD